MDDLEVYWHMKS